jgi:hypothetical protein
VRYYLERRDAEFEQKRAEVLCVFRQVQVLKKATKSKKPRKPVAIVSCDEKPEIQAIATTAPDCRRSLACILPSRVARQRRPEFDHDGSPTLDAILLSLAWLAP